MTAPIRSSIIAYVKQLIQNNLSRLDSSLELIDLTDAGKLQSNAISGTVVSIPLKVTVRGPAEASSKTTQLVKQIIIEYDPDLKSHLSDLDANAFQDVVSIST